jgi:hypothetical protein
METAARSRCCYCGQPCDPRYREVTGWEQVRSQGGANRIIARTETGRYVCTLHAQQIQRGLSPDQGTLL